MLWGTLYADDAGTVSRSPGELERMMAVIVTACSAFGLTFLRRQNGDYVPADNRWEEGVVHQHCSGPGIQTNDRICVLGRGYQHR